MARFVQNIVQGNSKAGAITSIVLTTGVTCASGDVLVLALVSQFSGSAPSFSVADSGLNTWTVFPEGNGVGTGNDLPVMVYSKLTTGLTATDTITVTATQPLDSYAVAVAEFANITALATETGATQSINWNSVNDTLGSTAPTTGGATTAVSPVLWIAACAVLGPTGDAYTEDTTNRSDGDNWHSLTRSGNSGGSALTNNVMNWAYKIPTSNVALNYTPTLGTSRQNVDGMWAFTATAEPVAGHSLLVNDRSMRRNSLIRR